MDLFDNLKIIELARHAPAELPGMILADFGADVIKVQPPPERETDPEGRGSVRSSVNRNKRSISIDLKSAAGRDAFRRLASKADVLLEGFRPGVMERLELDYDRLSALNPRLIYCSLTGYGQSGPYRLRPGHDINYIASGGVLALIGEPDGPPIVPLNLVADYGGASMHGLAAIAMALYARERSGRGCHVDVSYLDATVALLAATPNAQGLLDGGRKPRRGEGVLGGQYPYYAVYETMDGQYLSVGCTEHHFWQNFCNLVGLPHLARFARKAEHHGRPPNAEERAAYFSVQEIIRSQRLQDWVGIFQDQDVCVAEVKEPEELVNHPQLLHRRMIVDVDDPVHGSYRDFGSPFKFSTYEAVLRWAAPSPGKHTAEILRELGFSETDISEMRVARNVA